MKIKNLARLPKVKRPAKQAKKQAQLAPAMIEKQWKPGQSGNPAGRPKSITLSEAARKKLQQVYEADPQKRTFAELIIDTAINKAAQGERHSQEFIRKLTEGDTIHLKDWRTRAEEAGIPAEQIDKLGITFEKLVNRGAVAVDK